MRWIVIAALVVVGGVAACRESVTSAPAPAPSPPVVTAVDAAIAMTPTDAPIAPTAPAVGSTSCDRDDECIVSNFAGCCACPQCQVADPHAVTRAQEKLREDSCAVVDCDMHMCNVAGMCPPGETAAHFSPRCVDHACTMTRVAPK